jgi:hypothetical protein
VTFSQQFCSLARCGAGGRVVTGRRARNCLVQVADGKLVIVMAPSVLLASVPAPMVEILTPPALRTIGTSVVLWLGGLDGAPLVAVEFDTVYRRQRAFDRRAAADPESGFRTLGGVMRRLSGVSDITALPQAMRLGLSQDRRDQVPVPYSHPRAAGHPRILGTPGRSDRSHDARQPDRPGRRAECGR